MTQNEIVLKYLTRRLCMYVMLYPGLRRQLMSETSPRRMERKIARLMG